MVDLIKNGDSVGDMIYDVGDNTDNKGYNTGNDVVVTALS